MFFFALVYCLSSITESSPLLIDSEQEVPPGTTESVQSVDYYCDSKFKCNLLTFMWKVDLHWIFLFYILF